MGVRQSGASQTETIDGLDRRKSQRKTFACPQTDYRGMLTIPVAPGSNSCLFERVRVSGGSFGKSR